MITEQLAAAHEEIGRLTMLVRSLERAQEGEGEDHRLAALRDFIAQRPEMSGNSLHREAQSHGLGMNRARFFRLVKDVRT